MAFAGVGVVVVALVVTSFTGFPGPGALRRYPTADLAALVDAVHADAGELRTPDDCWKTTYGATQDAAPAGPPRPIAAVDRVRSRVVVRLHADLRGRVDSGTEGSARRRVRQVVRTDERFSDDMVVFEASPDGWSPSMSCPLVIRGWG